jgi:hypothetical protein
MEHHIYINAQTGENIVKATYGVYRCLTMTPDAWIVHKIEHYLGATYYAVWWNPSILFVEWVGLLEYIIKMTTFGGLDIKWL